MEKRTQEEYVKASGHCPYCGSDQIEGVGSVEVEGDNAYQDIYCLKCHKSWTDEYKLVGFTESES